MSLLEGQENLDTPWIFPTVTQHKKLQDALMVSDFSSILLDWAEETNKYVCDYVLAEGADAIQGKELAGAYYEGAIPIVETLILRAGRRLGSCINMLAAQKQESTTRRQVAQPG
jgi:hypothetical protein